MLDLFAIFTRGGALLWTLQFTSLRHSPIEALNALVKSCLLEERSGETTFTFVPKNGAHQALKWTFHNVRCGGDCWARLATGLPQRRCGDSQQQAQATGRSW